MGLAKPLGLLFCVSALLLVEPDFGAATVLFATGFGLLFLAGARLRYVIAMTAIAGASFGAAGGELELPHAAPDRVPGSLGRSLQQRLSADAVADRDRPRPVVRGGPGRLGAEALLPARGAHRLPVRRARRGAGAGRRGA